VLKTQNNSGAPVASTALHLSHYVIELVNNCKWTKNH